jgi:hypothetical protein
MASARAATARKLRAGNGSAGGATAAPAGSTPAPHRARPASSHRHIAPQQRITRRWISAVVRAGEGISRECPDKARSQSVATSDQVEAGAIVARLLEHPRASCSNVTGPTGSPFSLTWSRPAWMNHEPRRRRHRWKVRQASCPRFRAEVTSALGPGSFGRWCKTCRFVAG